MDSKEYLTNEQISKRFSKNQFDLVNYAIKLAENAIKAGREPVLKLDSQNMASLILAEIATNQDKFVELIPVPLEGEKSAGSETGKRDYQRNGGFDSPRKGSHRDDSGFSKSAEKKKGRKILA
jgi:hypothetical protein